MQLISGNIFTSKRQTLVNTVNCVGVMGAGIALEFKLRHPDMFREYADHCRNGRLAIGKLWLYKPAGGGQWVLNFPTKKHWRYPSKEEYLVRGLQNFVSTYEKRGVESAAFPLLGAANGGIPEDRSKTIMDTYLRRCEIPIDIYTHDPSVADDLYDFFKSQFDLADDVQLGRATRLRRDRVALIRRAMERPEVRSISRLASVKGIGPASVEKLFRYVMRNQGDRTSRDAEAAQGELSLHRLG